MTYRLLNASLNGTNCHLSGQPIVALQVLEDISADFDTAQATTIAGSLGQGASPFEKGSVVETYEGGYHTGSWEVEQWAELQSGEKTFRLSPDGSPGHIPLVSYSLKRKGYGRCRATIDRLMGIDPWPPRFWSRSYFNMVSHTMFWDAASGARPYGPWYYIDIKIRPIIVDSARDILVRVASWAGLSLDLSGVSFRSDYGYPEEYVPVGKSAIEVIREVASWSGASVRVMRNGTVRVYDFEAVFGRGAGSSGSEVTARTIFERTYHDTLVPVSAVSVVGNKWWYRLLYPQYDPVKGWMYPSPAAVKVSQPVEITEVFNSGSPAVVRRIEIGSYPIDEQMAVQIARSQLSQAVIPCAVCHINCAGDWAQHNEPVATRATRVSRNLQWTGQGYDYTCDIWYPYSAIGWPSNWDRWDQFGSSWTMGG